MKTQKKNFWNALFDEFNRVDEAAFLGKTLIAKTGDRIWSPKENRSQQWASIQQLSGEQDFSSLAA